jgi:hypothetical protein
MAQASVVSVNFIGAPLTVPAGLGYPAAAPAAAAASFFSFQRK